MSRVDEIRERQEIRRTADEYIDHYFEKGHDQGVKAAPASSDDLRRIACEIVHKHVPMTAQLTHGINGLENAIVDALSRNSPKEVKPND